jgi:hypothetical protein
VGEETLKRCFAPGPGIIYIKMDVNKKELGLALVIKAQEDLLKAYEKELRHLQRKNLRLKLHMEVIVRTPQCNTAAKLRKDYSTADFSDSVIYCN